MDKMSKYLDKKMVAYSMVNHTHCFNHILSLTGKALLKQFNVKKQQGDEGNNLDEILSAEENELLVLAAGIDDEELAMAQEMTAKIKDNDELIDEDLNELEEWIDEVSNEMTNEEWLVLASNICPVSHVLVKV